MLKEVIKISMAATLLLLGSNSAVDAKVADSKAKAAPAQASTPELTAAGERVNQAKEQLATAHKQLSAAKALLKAAEADYKAACAEREALALKTNAQNLADASGLQQVKSSGVGIAQRPVTPPVQSQTSDSPALGQPQPFDFNSEPPTSAPEPSSLR
jgi:hypothetical protein